MGDADAKETSFVRELGDARTMLEERRNESVGSFLAACLSTSASQRLDQARDRFQAYASEHPVLTVRGCCALAALTPQTFSALMILFSAIPVAAFVAWALTVAILSTIGAIAVVLTICLVLVGGGASSSDDAR